MKKGFIDFTVTMKQKKCHLPKGFLSVRGNPTQNALIMYFIYMTHLPDGWYITKLNEPAVQKVREYFGWDCESGFGTMIMWGILLSCAVSQTSKKRYLAMSKAFHDCLGMIGKGYVFSDKKL